MNKIIWTPEQLKKNGSSNKQIENLYNFFGGKNGKDSIHQIGYFNGDQQKPVFIDFKKYE